MPTPPSEDTWSDHLIYETVNEDILTIQADAWMIPVPVTLALPTYTLPRKLIEVGGQAVAERTQELRKVLGGKLAVGAAASIPTADIPGLPGRVVYAAWWEEKVEYSAAHIYRCYANALREAFAHGVRKMVVPMLGGSPKAGVRATMRAEQVRRLLTELNQCKGSGDFSVDHLIFADLSAENLAHLDAALAAGID